MGNLSITSDQLATVNSLIEQYPNDPSVVWATLSNDGDDYGTGAVNGLSNKSTFFNLVIISSNHVAGVSDATINQIAINNVSGYVGMLNEYANAHPGSYR